MATTSTLIESDSKSEYTTRFNALRNTLAGLDDAMLGALSAEGVDEDEKLVVLYGFNQVAEFERLVMYGKDADLDIDSEAFVRANECLAELEAAEKTGLHIEDDSEDSSDLDPNNCKLNVPIPLLVSLVRKQTLRTNLEVAVAYVYRSLEAMKSVEFPNTADDQVIQIRQDCTQMSERLLKAQPTVQFPLTLVPRHIRASHAIALDAHALYKRASELVQTSGVDISSE